MGVMKVHLRKARVCVRVVLVLALCGSPVAVGAAGQGDTTPIGDLFHRVTLVVGPNPMECGRLLLTGRQPLPITVARLNAAIRCGVNAAAARKPFWLVTELRGMDSWIGEGLIGDESGQIYRFAYDSDPSGGGVLGLEPAFTRWPCDRPSARRDKTLGAAVVVCRSRPAPARP